MSKAADRFPPGTILAGKLRVVRRLGVGGMGAVYEVEHTLTHHRRALKLLHTEMGANPAVVERFLREASAAGRIGNPHIVETFDAGYLDTGEPYIVMELLEGKTLATLLEDKGPLSVDRACGVLEQVADGVAAAHAAGIVHRDLKPENIFLTGPETSFVKLLDFGVSKFDVDTTGVATLTLEGSPIGTPYYMAPEQVRGERSVDARSDIYALGVLLYECLTGRKPYVADTLPHLAVLIHEGKFSPATAVRQGLPSAVDVIIARAMAANPAERYARAQDLAAQLGRLRDALGPLGQVRTQPAVTAPPQAPLPGTLTPAPVSHTSAGQRKSNSAAMLAVGLGGVLLLGGAGVLIARSSADPAPTPERSTASVPSPGFDAAPQGSLSLSRAAPVGAAGAPSEAASAPSASASAKPRAAAPRSSSLPATPAQKHGLADNPFP